MKQEKINNSDLVMDKPASEMSKNELSQRVDEAFDQIGKRAKWNVALSLALITSALWVSILCSLERHLGYKLVIVSLLALITMIKSVIDQLMIAKLKKASSRKEQLDRVVSSRKFESLVKWGTIAFFFLYLLVDVLQERTVSMMIVATAIFLIIMFIVLATFDKTKSYQRSVELEDDLRKLVEMEER